MSELHILDRSYHDALLELAELLAPVLDADALQAVADLEPGPLIVLALCPPYEPRAVGFTEATAALAAVRRVLASGEPIRLTWRVGTTLGAALAALCDERERRSSTLQ
jgi:hypothetical protein